MDSNKNDLLALLTPARPAGVCCLPRPTLRHSSPVPFPSLIQHKFVELRCLLCAGPGGIETHRR